MTAVPRVGVYDFNDASQCTSEVPTFPQFHLIIPNRSHSQESSRPQSEMILSISSIPTLPRTPDKQEVSTHSPV